jgi:periplasmic divalent cation tolerance protein
MGRGSKSPEGRMTETEFVVVLVTVGSRAEGESVARRLVDEKLAACVNVVGPIRSVYVWKGEVAEEDEHVLIIKSRRPLFAALETRVRALHSYDVPEVIALSVVEGSTPYLDWLRGATTGTSPRA